MNERSKGKPVDILLIEDNPGDIRLLKEMLDEIIEVNFNLSTAGSLGDGLRKLRPDCNDPNNFKINIDIILLDLSLPDSQGIQTFQTLSSRISTIPVILLTGHDDMDTATGLIREGAQDYLVKGRVEPETLKRSVFYALERFRLNDRLKKANLKILEQQQALLEEEHIKTILQMTGLSANELNQPLMDLLGNIEHLQKYLNDPNSMKTIIKDIKDNERQITNIIKIIQKIPYNYADEYFETISSEIKCFNATKIINILYVEDDQMIFNLISRMFEKIHPAALAKAGTINEAKELLLNNKFDLLLFDFKLPDGDAFELLDFVKANELEMPVVILTGQGDERIASSVINAGAHEYLSKGSLSVDDLFNGINNAFKRFEIQKNWRQSVAKIAELSIQDELTGLYYRRYMNDRIVRDINHANRYNLNLACMILDLDHFKKINDTYGHACGDYVLKEFASRLKKIIRKTDNAFRYGGDEFLILLPDTNFQGVKKLADKIRISCQADGYNFNNKQFNISVSIGFSMLQECRARNIFDIVAIADKALYMAKADGRNRVRSCRDVLKTDQNAMDKIPVPDGYQYLKEQLENIFYNIKISSLNAIDSLLSKIDNDGITQPCCMIIYYIKLLCDRLNLPESLASSIIRAAQMHGCFKILIGDKVLKKEKPLTPAERELINQHPLILVDLMNLLNIFSGEKLVLTYHHENYNGSGYPYGIEGNDIPIGARIFAVAEAVAAMNSDRPYRKALKPKNVVKELTINAGRQFDPKLIYSLLDIISEEHIMNVPEKIIVKSKKQLKSMYMDN